MHVQKGHAFALTQTPAIDGEQFAANPVERADSHMSGDQRIRHAGEPAGVQMHIRAANLGQLHFERGRIRLEFGICVLANLDPRARRRDHGRAYAHGSFLFGRSH